MIKINFCLTLPVQENADQVRAKMKALNDFCANRPFSAIGPVEDMPKEATQFAEPVVPEEVIGFRFKVANEGPEFALKMAKFPDKGRAPLVWYCDSFVYIPKELNIQMYIIKYKAFMDALFEAQKLGFNVRIDDEAGYASEEGKLVGQRDHERLVSAIMRDRKFLDPRDMVR